MILDEIRQHISETYPGRLKNLSISDVSIGLHMTAVQLSDGSTGIAATEADEQIHCSKKNRDFTEFTPLQILGRAVEELLASRKTSSLVRSLQIAVLNAVSSRLIEEKQYKVLENTDPVDLLDLTGHREITIVGAFQSYIRKIAATNNRLQVLELNELALMPEHRHFYIPAKEYTRVLANAEVIIITGLTLVNNTLDQLLRSCRAGSIIILTGPSSSILPDVLFRHGVALLGGTRITKPELLMPLVRQGATGYHLFEYCAEKICIVNGQVSNRIYTEQPADTKSLSL
ncbi:MAG: DUF364 domain-containing protein [Bacteroidota bacterium]